MIYTKWSAQALAQGTYGTNVSNKSDRSFRGPFSCQVACQAPSTHRLASHNPGERVFLFVLILQMKMLSLSWAERSAQKSWPWVSNPDPPALASRFPMSPVQPRASCSQSSLGRKQTRFFRAEPNAISRGNTWHWLEGFLSCPI